MSKERIKYDQTFKENAVKLSHDRKNVSELARELGINSALLYRWRKEHAQYGKESFPGNGNPKPTAQEKEIADLKTKLARLELEHEILKSSAHLLERREVKYSFIQKNERMYPIELMCIILKVSRSGYYRFRNQVNTKRIQAKKILQTKIQKVYFEYNGIYGSLRLAVELTAQGSPLSRRTTALYMKEMGLKSRIAPQFKNTTDSNHKEPICENLLDRHFSPEEASKAWVSDITYIRTLFGFEYLTVIIDLYDRKVIGWSQSSTMAASDTILKALQLAIKNRKPRNGTIFHSDRGVQYTSTAVRNVIASHGMKQSMSRKGNCWDNAVAENFFKSPKTELIYGNKLKTKEDMTAALFKYIEIWYNRNRRHSHLKNMTIREFWKQKYIKNIQIINAA